MGRSPTIAEFAFAIESRINCVDFDWVAYLQKKNSLAGLSIGRGWEGQRSSSCFQLICSLRVLLDALL
jgi:hypothetical protein